MWYLFLQQKSTAKVIKNSHKEALGGCYYRSNRFVFPALGIACFRKDVIPTLERAVAWDLCFLKPSIKVFFV